MSGRESFDTWEVVGVSLTHEAKSRGESALEFGDVLTEQEGQDGQTATNDSAGHFGHPERGALACVWRGGSGGTYVQKATYVS